MVPGSVPTITAAAYLSITDRHTNAEALQHELQRIIAAQPTQIHPDERTRFLDSILADLEDRDDAPWATWSEDLLALALTAIKTLGRNPSGSETLLSDSHLRTLYYHSALPFPPFTPASVRLPPGPYTPSALEALKVLANTLLLHSTGRDRFAKAGGAQAVARALAGRSTEGHLVEVVGNKEIERIFLLGRLGFLVTLQRRDAVQSMVDKEELIESLIYHLCSIPLVQPNYMAVTELLKLATNMLHSYPFTGVPSASPHLDHKGNADWDQRFDPLLYPILIIYHNLPNLTLAPPLSTCLHTLFAFPFLAHLLPTWVSTPESPSPRTPTPQSHTGVRGILSNLARATVSATSRRSLDTGSDGQGSRGSKSPSLPSSPEVGHSHARHCTLLPSRSDPTAFPGKTLDVLDAFFDAYLPFPTNPDDELLEGLSLDEQLGPVLALLGKAAAGSEEMRKYMRHRLLPPDLDRSAEGGTLERRQGTLGNLLRLMQCSTHPACRDTAGELLWNVCGADPKILSHEVGYGNAAGLLFQKGISQPPPAHITEISGTAHSTPASSASASAKNEVDSRNPITSLAASEDSRSPMDGMTPEEREREAERLFVLFDRMEKNPIISAKSDSAEGDQQIGVKDAVRRKMEGLDEAKWQAEERQREEEEDQRDEEEAIRDLEAYRKRRTGP